jgi:hypothetical protein
MQNEAPLPGPVREAHRELRVYRQQVGLGAGAVMVGGLALAVLGVPHLFWPVVAALLVVAGIYLFPPGGEARRARLLLAEWEEGAGGLAQEGDPRIQAAEEMVRRIETHAGEDSPSSRAARELLQTLYDAEEDLRAIASLRRLEEAQGPTGSSTPRPEGLRRRAGALEARVQERITAALDALAELFEAVIGRDREHLRTVLGRAREELHRLQAASEVDALTTSTDPPVR